MTITAVIAEYNPFHNGHLYQLQQAREMTGADLLFVICSGNFVQRGDASCIDQYAKTRMALSCGADVVFALPVYGSTASAELFAESAVHLLEWLGCIDYLCFGAENTNLTAFTEIAKVLCEESGLFRETLQSELKHGKNFAAARSTAVCACCDNPSYASLLSSPNNILVIEYLKALIKLNSTIKPAIVQRIGAGYHAIDTEYGFASATGIRAPLSQQTDDFDALHMPDAAIRLLEHYHTERGLIFRNDFSEMLGVKLLDPHENLMDYMDITTDIANLIDKNRLNFLSIDQFINILANRSMTKTRIARCLFHILLSCRKDTFSLWRERGYQGYIRLLGFRQTASDFWQNIPVDVRKAVVTSPLKAKNTLTPQSHAILTHDLYASELYRQAVQCKYHHILPSIYSEPTIIM